MNYDITVTGQNEEKNNWIDQMIYPFIIQDKTKNKMIVILSHYNREKDTYCGVVINRKDSWKKNVSITKKILEEWEPFKGTITITTEGK